MTCFKISFCLELYSREILKRYFGREEGEIERGGERTNPVTAWILHFK